MENFESKRINPDDYPVEGPEHPDPMPEPKPGPRPKLSMETPQQPDWGLDGPDTMPTTEPGPVGIKNQLNKILDDNTFTSFIH